MQAQGITLMTSKATNVKVTKKSTQATDATFDSFIKGNASPTGGQDKMVKTESKQAQVSKADTSSDVKTESAKSDEKVSDGKLDNNRSDQNTDVKAAGSEKPVKAETTDTKTDVKTDAVTMGDAQDADVTEAANEIMAIIQSMLGLSVQDVEDIFEQMGMRPEQLMTGLRTGEIESVSITTVQTFVMEVHGIEDPAAFVTNDLLNTELKNLTDELEKLALKLIGSDAKDFASVTVDEFESFAQKLLSAVPAKETPVREDVVSKTDASVTVDEDIEGDVGPLVIVEKSDDSEQSGTEGESQEGHQSDEGLGRKELRQTAADEHQGAQVAAANTDTFTQRLAESVRTEQTQAAQTQLRMTQIVEQVVRQVRIRVMPETTSMEMQLHPQSLGKVVVQINATAAQTTARLAVETEAARQALQSQLENLKQTFEERGLKVTEVEVTVMNFSLNERSENQYRPDDETSSGNKKGSNSFTDVGDEDDTDVDGDLTQTDASRVSADSTVDYTA